MVISLMTKQPKITFGQRKLVINTLIKCVCMLIGWRGSGRQWDEKGGLGHTDAMGKEICITLALLAF